ncbi:MAG: TatD family hydrolase [Bacteroidia bacterium]|jgi:TatD DNase family protein|nr:TatD family hydrolase [Bacteroidia bacterium]
MEMYYNIHTHFKPKLPNEIAIRNGFLMLTANQYEQLPYPIAVGLHPWLLNHLSVNEATDALLERATLSNVKAIGEIGIDRAIQTPIDVQVAYFEAQLTVARALQKPVIIHAVRSYSDFLPYLKKHNLPMVFHGFNGNLQQAKELIKHGAYLSFGRHLLEPKLAEWLSQIPLTSIFLETDNAPHLTIAQVYQKAATLLNLSEADLCEKIAQNWKQLFG